MAHRLNRHNITSPDNMLLDVYLTLSLQSLSNSAQVRLNPHPASISSRPKTNYCQAGIAPQRFDASQTGLPGQVSLV